MLRLIRIILAGFLFLSLQSCIVKRSSNMPFVNRADIGRDAEVVAVNVPRILLKTFIRSEIKELKEEDPMLALALKRIKSIKLLTIEGAKDNDHVSRKFSNYLSKNRYEEMMSIYSDGSRISINTLMKGDRIKGVLLGIKDEEDQVYVNLKTDINLEELNQLVDYYEHNNKKSAKLEKADTP